MKSLIITALVLGLSAMSCKKEAQTERSLESDSLANMDSMDVNSSPPLTSDSMNNMQSNMDTANLQNNKDSVTAPPK